MGKIVLAIMDGVGYSKNIEGNAVLTANTPNLDKLYKCPHTLLKAHGKAVGMPSDNDMGNSEVGHNAIGSGQIYSQGAKLIDDKLKDGSLFTNKNWVNVVNSDKTLHFIGLLSDGNVHSNISHLKQMIIKAKEDKIKKIRLHILLDGRDVYELSALKYVEDIENLINKLNDNSFDCKIASGGGRMSITMDRYESNWSMVEKGWHAHVLGDARKFNSAKEAIETYRKELNCIDQDLPAFVISNVDGTIEDYDNVILFNFRGDRAIEISKAFEYENFDYFDRIRYPKVNYIGMLQYDGDLKLPKNYLVDPPKIINTMAEYFVKNNIKTYSISETQKFGHVTYFFNGNHTEKFDEKLETWQNIPSDNISFDKKPEMKSKEITDELIKNMGEYEFMLINYPNGDMVGHTGDFSATVKAMEAVDKQIGRLMDACKQKGYTLIVTADHGNAEEMISDKKIKTSHTLNPVVFVIQKDVIFKEGNFGLSNIEATIFKLMNLEIPSPWNESMIK